MNISFSRKLIAASTIALAAVAIVPTTAAAAAPTAVSASHAAGNKALTPSETLASTPWKTTSARDAQGDRVALDDPAVSNFVGWAYFKADGTFTMYNLDNSPKMHGDWSVPADGSSRWIAAKDANGNVLFQRVVPIVELNKNVFTYRVFPNAADQTVYYDIVHTKTNHVEPGTDGRGPGANGHGTTGNGDYHFNNGNAR
ncbi:DUF4822 domain-containing protein [Microbacterium sp. Au-Mic1]|uniref:DUF4822 domain-containing protein n=1 Tax=Microbacterium sp. Au-Mic1 TaxID=2906457 RepID=UPI001E3C90FF|nr:DUF4822 domain-containing protein [Microbacterium sp. Au-Mic1]MCE4027128.1 DUF4822 domain-containing protein [Microbacterium sp. Au-Mic1]